MKKFLPILAILILTQLKGIAQPPPPSGTSGAGGGAAQAPLDGGISLLIAAGAYLGGKKSGVFQKKK